MNGSVSSKSKKIFKIILLTVLGMLAIWNLLWLYYRFVVVASYYENENFVRVDEYEYCYENGDIYLSVYLPQYLYFEGGIGMCGSTYIDRIGDQKMINYGAEIKLFSNDMEQYFDAGIISKENVAKGEMICTGTYFGINNELEVSKIKSIGQTEEESMALFEKCRSDIEEYYSLAKKVWGDKLH